MALAREVTEYYVYLADGTEPAKTLGPLPPSLVCSGLRFGFGFCALNLRWVGPPGPTVVGEVCPSNIWDMQQRSDNLGVYWYNLGVYWYARLFSG